MDLHRVQGMHGRNCACLEVLVASRRLPSHHLNHEPGRPRESLEVAMRTPHMLSMSPPL